VPGSGWPGLTRDLRRARRFRTWLGQPADALRAIHDDGGHFDPRFSEALMTLGLDRLARLRARRQPLRETLAA